MNKQPDHDDWEVSLHARVPAVARPREAAPWQPETAYSGPAGDSEPAEEGNFVRDLWRYFWILVRHRWVVLGVTLSFMCVGLLVTFLSTPIYRASATIQIDREPAKVLNLEEVEANRGNEAAFLATQYEILKSRALAEQVVSNLSVQELHGFTKYSTVSPWSRVRQAVMGSEDDAADVEVSTLQKAAVNRVRGGLSIQPVGTSRVVRLSFEGPDAGWAQRIANSVSNTFLALTLERRFDASSYARGFLEDRLKELKLKLEDSEAEVVAYAQNQGIVNVDETRSLVSEDLGALNKELAETSRQRLTAEQLLEQAETTDGLSLPQIIGDESIRKMRERRAEFAADYQDKLSFFKPEYPEMLQLAAKIGEIDRQIQEFVETVRQSLRANYEALLAQENSLKNELENLKAAALDLQGRGIQYRILQREVDTNRQLYEGLLQRYKEVGVAGAVGTNNVSIVDQALRPGSPYKPSLSKNLALFFAFGLICGGLAAFGIEFLDDTFKVPEEIESALGLPVLGIIPIADDPEALEEALADSRSPVSEAYRSLRTALQFSTADGAPRTLLVTSSMPGEGKSTTSLSIARNFAQLGQRVLLIDADLRNPSLHKVLNRSVSAGLSNYLTGNKLLSGMFQLADEEGLTLMMSGPLPPNPAELLASSKMGSLLSVASEKFDIVVIDGPPVMGLADAPLLASVADGTLLIVEAGQTRRGMTKVALKRLHFARAQMVGVLLSKFNARNVGHTYSYGNGYGYGYGDSDYYGYGTKPVPELETESTARLERA